MNGLCVGYLRYPDGLCYFVTRSNGQACERGRQIFYFRSANVGGGRGLRMGMEVVGRLGIRGVFQSLDDDGIIEILALV